MMDKLTVALMNIGNEILHGQIVDTNTSYCASSLYVAGIKLCKVVILPDVIDQISKEVLTLSKTFSIVFTSGGVGPTHDDVTYEAIAKAFDLKLEKNQKLVDLYARMFPDHPEFEQFAIVPSPCELIQIELKHSKQKTLFVIKVNNVYVLPGSPKYFRSAIDEILLQIQSDIPLFNTAIDIALDELLIVKILNEHVARWKNIVSFGSYPQSEMNVCTRITFEGEREAVLKAKQEFIASFPPSVVNINKKFHLHEAQSVVRNGANHMHIYNALNLLEQCYNTYKPNEIFLSFNGGKDCTVVLHLAVTVMRLRGLEQLLCLYVTGDTFAEVDMFVEKAVNYYGVHLIRKETPIQSALANLTEEKPCLKACIMGVRKTDPGSANLEPFAQTDPGWPQLIRVNPILDWSYKQVWDFLLIHNIPYCPLYDQGYSSLGSKTTTMRNPLLRDPKNPSSYLPAQTLSNELTERQGRKN